MPFLLLAFTKLKNGTFILLHILYISTVFLPILDYCVVSYVALKTPFNEVDTYPLLRYMLVKTLRHEWIFRTITIDVEIFSYLS